MAEQNRPYGGFSSFLGLPQGATRETLLRDKRAKNVAKFNEEMQRQAQAVPQAQRPVFETFAKLGNVLGSKLNGGPAYGDAALDPEEDRAITVMEKANERMKEIRQSEDFAKADPINQSFMMQKAVADAAYEVGDIDGYVNTIRDLTEKRIAFREAEARTTSLEADADLKKAQLPGQMAAADAAFSAFQKGKPETFIKITDGQMDITDPEILTRMPNGEVVDQSGQVVDPTQFLPLDDALSISDQMGKNAKANATGVMTPASLVKQIGVANVAKESAMLDEVETMVKTTERISQVFNESVDPHQFVGKQGGLVSFGADMLNLVQGTAKTAGLIFKEVDADGKGKGTGKSFLEYADDLVPDEMLPEGLRRNGMFGKLSEEAVRYKGAIMQMIYANARMQEPGARQLSDADIRNSAETLGVSSGDPLTVMRRLGEVTMDRLAGTRGTFERRAAQASAYGMDPTVALQKMYGADALSTIDSAMERASAAFGRGESAARETTPAADGTAQGGPAVDPQMDAWLKSRGL